MQSSSGQNIPRLQWTNPPSVYMNTDVAGYHIWRQQDYPVQGTKVLIAEVSKNQFSTYDSSGTYRYIFDDVGFKPNAGYLYSVAPYDTTHNEEISLPSHFFSLPGTFPDPQCGNGVLDLASGEQCDGTNLNGNTCETHGYTNGTLACSPTSCLFDLSKCIIAQVTCGNGTVDPGEQCDGTNLDGKTCWTRGYPGGTLACSPTSCLFDESNCTVPLRQCGNGVVDPGEQCDGWSVNGTLCSAIGQGFTGGALFCSGCQYDTQACTGVAGSSSSCTEWWVCEPWSSCSAGTITRKCTDHHYCGTANSRPILTGSCSSGATTSCVENWSCSAWSSCTNGVQSRSCTDTNNCGTTTSKPATSQQCTATTANCGDGILQSGEQCDGTNMNGKTCANLGNAFTGGTLTCSSTCQFDTTQCVASLLHCGDGVVQSGEQCDLTNLNGKTCATAGLGFTGGTLLCSVGSCTFDISKCTGYIPPPGTATCNNGLLESGEECDLQNVGGKRCTDFPNFSGGTLGCSSNCTLDKRGCTVITAIPTAGQSCGNGIVEGNEFCDGSAIAAYLPKDCSILGNFTGTLSCGKNCAHLDPISCTTPSGEPYYRCGNGKLENNEECDGTNLNNARCNSFKGFSGGTLSCTSSCTFDRSACVVFNPAGTVPSNTPSSDTKVTSPGTITQPPAVTIQEEQKLQAGLEQQPSLDDPTYTADVARYCATFGVTDSSQCSALVSNEIDIECKNAGIKTRQQCEIFLHKPYVDDTCVSEDIAAGETCQSTIYDRYKDELYCGGLDADACKTIATKRFLGQVVSGVQKNRDFNIAMSEKIGPSTTVGDIVTIIRESKLPDETFPVLTDASRRIMVRSSDRTIDVSSKVVTDITSPYVIFFDDDGDDIPNDLEREYGTDPNNSDSDGDGYDDKTEIENGFDPTRTGGPPTGRELTGIEQALIDNVPVEQPLTKGEVDPEFTVEKIDTVTEEDEITYTISGKGAPHTLLTVYLYSEMPLVLAVRTDEFGNWVYTLDSDLVDGKHVAYVSVLDDEGRITKKSEPLSFFIRRAQAVTATSFLLDEAIVTPPTTSFLTYYAVGGISIAFIGFALFLFYLLRKNRHVGQ